MPQPDQGGGRKYPVGWVDDRPANGERNFVRGCNPGRDMGLHVHSGRRGLRTQLAFFPGICDGPVDTRNFAMQGLRESFDQAPRPGLIHGMPFVCGAHSRIR